MAVLDMPVRNGWDKTGPANKYPETKGVPLHELSFAHGSPSMTARILADPASLMDSKYYGAYAFRNIDYKQRKNNYANRTGAQNEVGLLTASSRQLVFFQVINTRQDS